MCWKLTALHHLYCCTTSPILLYSLFLKYILNVQGKMMLLLPLKRTWYWTSKEVDDTWHETIVCINWKTLNFVNLSPFWSIKWYLCSWKVIPSTIIGFINWRIYDAFQVLIHNWKIWTIFTWIKLYSNSCFL